MKKVLWLTTQKPSAMNEEGPSGLPLEIMRQLKEMRYDVTLDYVEIRNPIMARLARLGIFFKNYANNLDIYDKILVYPDGVTNIVPHKYWYKTISMGPDAASFGMARMYRISHGWRKISFYIYINILLRNESKWMKGLHRLCVVGKNDRRWLRLHSTEKDKAFFLVHPFLSKALVDLDSLKPHICAEKRFVFAGDLSRHYVGRFFEELLAAINQRGAAFSILVVGKRNKWVYDILRDAGSCDVKYQSWVEDYREICILGKDIHCIPLFAGSGTKNRTLTALANGLQIITTPVGLENIYHSGVKGIQLCNNATEFVVSMLEMQQHNMTYDDFDDMLESRKRFRLDIDSRFKKTLEEVLQ